MHPSSWHHAMSHGQTHLRGRPVWLAPGQQAQPQANITTKAASHGPPPPDILQQQCRSEDFWRLMSEPFKMSCQNRSKVTRVYAHEGQRARGPPTRGEVAWECRR